MNKKKSMVKGKTFFTITLVFVVCCLMATGSWAAKKVEFYSANAEGYIRLLNENGCRESSAIANTLGLSRDEGFLLLQKSTDFNRVTHYRYQQTYKGIPVWGMQTIVSLGPGNKVVRLNGAVVLDTANDIQGIPPGSSLDPLGALKQMETLHKQRNMSASWHFRNEQYDTNIYIDKNGKAHLCHVVSFFAETECGDPSRFIHFIEVKTGKVLHSFDMLAYAWGTGPGGNLKTGRYYYGTDFPPFPVTENSGICTMNVPDVLTVDMNHLTVGTTPYSYTCYENTHEPINGGYCPLNDAQFFGQLTCDMYKNWYGTLPVPSQLKLRCHYSVNFDNAFWDGGYLTMGDGYTMYYPLAGLDLIAHEASHGFTEYNSGLIYMGQPGGINDSFSDMAGEAADYYRRGTTDFLVRSEILKTLTALRYLCDPPWDGHSIDHVDDYYEGMEPHYSSGIFNKVFCLLSSTSGWSVRMAFDIFFKANRDYWTSSTTFQQGADGAAYAAMDYGYPVSDVAAAFDVVGIHVFCAPPIADFIGVPTMGAAPLVVMFTDLSAGSPGSFLWDFGDGGTSTAQHPSHIYIQEGSYTVSLTVSNSCGIDTEIKPGYIKVYCASSGGSQANEYIARAVAADLSNPSGPSPYTNFTQLAAHLNRGGTFNVSLTPGFPGIGRTEYWKIWIDYNGDRDLVDVGEEVFNASGNSMVTGSFTVPGNTIIGDTLMRVSMKYGSFPTPCETFAYGEVEDYTANISCTGTIINPDFETGTTYGWVKTGLVGITSDSHTGLFAVSLNGPGSSVQQKIGSLCGSTTYTVSCWGKGKASDGVYLGVRDYGGSELTVQFLDSKTFVKKSITFTTGPQNTGVTIFFIKLSGRTPGIGDDFEIN
jgi:vibriolysin